MAAVATPAEIAARTASMRALPDAVRVEAIREASNVVGYDRFLARARQVALRPTYRKAFRGRRP